MLDGDDILNQQFSVQPIENVSMANSVLAKNCLEDPSSEYLKITDYTISYTLISISLFGAIISISSFQARDK